MKSVAFFNNKGGVGKTSLVYHLGWMLQDLGVYVIVTDLDPQSNLTAAFLLEDRLEELWPDGNHDTTILGAVQPLLDRLGDIAKPQVESVTDRLGLIAGDLGLSMFEDRLAAAWTAYLDDNKANSSDGFRVMTAFYRIMTQAASERNAQLALVDVGPNLGAINRAALVASDHVVVPLGADLFSLQGLRNLGPTLRDWRKGWQKRLQGEVPSGIPVPKGGMQPVGYVIVQPAVRGDRPVKAYRRWVQRTPEVYHREVLGREGSPSDPDSNMLGTLKHYRSLMPLAQDARKPMFSLKPADGALGGHTQAVADCYRDFEQLARKIADACDIALPQS